MSCLTIQSPVHCLVNHLSLQPAQDHHKAFNINKARRSSPLTAVTGDPADRAGVARCNLFCRPGRVCPGVSASRWGWGRQVALGSKTRRGRKTKQKPVIQTKGFVGLQRKRPKSCFTPGERGGESWGWGRTGSRGLGRDISCGEACIGC